MPGDPTLSLLGYIFRGVREGLSANAIQRVAIEAGVGINRKRFLQAVGEVRASIARQPDLGGLQGDLAIPEDMHTEVSFAGPTPYRYGGRALVRRPGSPDIETIHYGVVSDAPLAPDEVAARGEADVDRGNREGSDPVTFLGSFMTYALRRPTIFA